jgi:uncharacterized protein
MSSLSTREETRHEHASQGHGHEPVAMTMKADNGAGKTCPICGKPAAGRHLPFCSSRCADIDLGRWLKGAYAIPVSESEEADESEEEGAERDGND